MAQVPATPLPRLATPFFHLIRFIAYRLGRLLTWLPRNWALRICDLSADLQEVCHRRRRRVALKNLFPSFPPERLDRLSRDMFRRKLRSQYYRHVQLARGLGWQQGFVEWSASGELEECLQEGRPILLAAWHYGPKYLLLEALVKWGKPTWALLGEGTQPGRFGNLEIAHLSHEQSVAQHSRILYQAYQALRSGRVVMIMADSAWGAAQTIPYLGGNLLINPALEILQRRTGAKIFPFLAIEQPLGRPRIYLGSSVAGSFALGDWLAAVTQSYPEDLPEVRIWNRPNVQPQALE